MIIIIALMAIVIYTYFVTLMPYFYNGKSDSCIGHLSVEWIVDFSASHLILYILFLTNIYTIIICIISYFRCVFTGMDDLFSADHS